MLSPDPSLIAGTRHFDLILSSLFVQHHTMKSIFLRLGVLCLQIFFFPSCFADRLPYLRNDEYNSGRYGQYVTQTFKSNPDIDAPVLNFMRSFAPCDDGSLLFITPRGSAIKSTPMILDAR